MKKQFEQKWKGSIERKKYWDDKVIQIQYKGSRFVVLPNNDYESRHWQ